MPALIIFQRRWLISCDDLVIPFAFESFLRTVWFILSLVITWLHYDTCETPLISAIFLYAVIIDLAISTCLAVIIAYLSAQGSVMETEKREMVSVILYMKLITVLFGCGIGSIGIWLFLSPDDLTSCMLQNIFIKVTTILAWIYFFIIVIGVALCYNSLGSLKYSRNDAIKNNSIPANFFKKARNIWKLRLKTVCCFADRNEENDLIYVEISNFLASFLTNIDFAPTDALAGLITLSGKHALEKTKILLNKTPDIIHSPDHKPIPEWMSIKNAIYFLRIAKSTYGWIAFADLFHLCNLCALSSHLRCCFTPSSSNKLDNCCYCNIAAVQKITNFSDSDILYASFHNSIHEPAFYVVVDHHSSSIIIAIRGTLSFSDIVTDIDAEDEAFPNLEGTPSFKCHRGILRSALLLYKKIEDLNLLAVAFSENSSYTLVITGHSLGGSIAAILSLLLRPSYPNLRCYAFAPLSVISVEGISNTLDYIFTIVVGDDVSPRLCVNSCQELRLEMIKSLEEIKLPKYKIISGALLYHLKKSLGKHPKKLITEGHYNINFEDGDTYLQAPHDLILAKDPKLYAPGRILYFQRKPGLKYFSSWETGIYFHRIIVSPRMLSDHQPHVIQSILESHNKECDSKSEPHTNIINHETDVKIEIDSDEK